MISSERISRIKDIELFLAFFVEVVISAAIVPWSIPEAIKNFNITKRSYLESLKK